MISILINAYACSPGMGSEPGMAWNWCVNLAKYCELHIITEGEFWEKIENSLTPNSLTPCLFPKGQGGDMPLSNEFLKNSIPRDERIDNAPVNEYGLTATQIRNLHFYYNPIGGDNNERCAKIRRMCWNQGDWRFYKYYRQWQWRTYLMAKEICKKHHIDVLHQLNMIGFREPGYLWKIEGVPLVWGPVDAKDAFPVEYLDGAGFKVKAFMSLKNRITQWQLQHSERVRNMVKRSSVVVSASSNSQKAFKKYFGIDSPLINETGCYEKEATEIKMTQKDTFDLLWVGKMDFRKQLVLAIRAVATAFHHDIRLHVVGGGDVSVYQNEAEKFGIMDLCIWHGAVLHDEVQRIMCQSDLFFFTSVAEGTPHVVLEAIGNGLPVLCFDTCGQGDCVNDKVGIKIPLTNPQQSVKDFAEQIEYLYSHRDVLKQMSDNCAEHRKKLSWDWKARQMVNLYNKILKQ